MNHADPFDRFADKGLPLFSQYGGQLFGQLVHWTYFTSTVDQEQWFDLKRVFTWDQGESCLPLGETVPLSQINPCLFLEKREESFVDLCLHVFPERLHGGSHPKLQHAL